MTTAERVSLREAGQTLVLLIESAELVPVGKYPEYSFIGADPEGDPDTMVDLRVPQKSADRQLGRLIMTLGETVGCTLRFSRDENKADAAKPYWGITLVSGAKDSSGGPSNGGAGAQTKTSIEPPLPPKPAPVTRQQVEKVLDAQAVEFSDPLYVAITKFVWKEIWPLHAKAFDSQVAAQIAATLYIQASRR